MYMSWSYADGVSRQCLAVSRTGDPMGAYARYAFTYATNPDYSKLGVWPPDAYVFTTQLPQQASTPLACAFDRQRMIAGLDAVQQCLPLPVDRGQNSYPVPVDVDGRAPPPAGSSAYLVTAPVWNDLGVFRLHVDWSDPSRPSLSPRQSVTVAPWNEAASALAVTQPRTTQCLTASTGWLRHRLAYRNFADHEALVVAHTVDVSGTIGIRWYELRPDGSGGLRVEQQGTFSPDGHHRFVPSAAMDARGNLALGYSVSSDVVYPSIRYAARLANDPLGTLTMAEGSLLEGTESQTNSSGGATTRPCRSTRRTTAPSGTRPSTSRRTWRRASAHSGCRAARVPTNFRFPLIRWNATWNLAARSNTRSGRGPSSRFPRSSTSPRRTFRRACAPRSFLRRSSPAEAHR